MISTRWFRRISPDTVPFGPERPPHVASAPLVAASQSPSVHISPDGEIFRIRPLLPCDRERLRDGFRRASRETLLHRFFRHRTRITEGELTYLTNVDQEQHVALCAGRVDDRHATGAAVARFLRDDIHPERAEFAITVVDEFQECGLGTALFRRLVHEAHLRDVTQLWGHVLADNEGALRWMESLGGKAAYLGEVYQVVFDVESLVG